MSRPAMSDLEMARLAFPGKPDAMLVMALAQDTLSELAMEPPISHEIVASMRDIARIEETTLPWPGCLVLEPGGFVIKLRATDSRGRRRFTVFHEVKHTYMPGFAVRTQYRCNPRAPRDASDVRDKDREALCDLGAAELLLPRSKFISDIDGNSATLGLVEQLAERYDASLEATARRVVTLRPQPTLLIALEPACKPSAPLGNPKLRVQWVQLSGSWPFIPMHKSVPDDGPLGRTLLGEVVNESGVLTGLANVPIEDVNISAGLYPYSDDQGEQHMRVLALITHTARRLGNRHAAGNP